MYSKVSKRFIFGHLVSDEKYDTCANECHKSKVTKNTLLHLSIHILKRTQMKIYVYFYHHSITEYPACWKKSVNN
ncbi:hypothetical protein KSF78_0009009 [Schistosoma japonicum]|nr:hypothetical protein KSF78_0009009 [Schistosoma japonicum]